MALVPCGTILYPELARVNAGINPSGSAGLGMASNGPSNRVGWVVQVPRSGTIDRLGTYIQSASAPALCRLGLYTVDGNGNPTSTAYGGSAYGTFTPSAGAYSEVTLAAPATANAGDVAAVMVDWDSTAGNIQIGGCTGGPTIGFPRIAQYQYSTWNANNGYVPGAAIRYNDGGYGDFYSVPLASPPSSYTVGSGSAPNEYGLSFTTPFGCRVAGLWAITYERGSGSTYSLVLYDATGSNLLAQAAWNSRASGQYLYGARLLRFASPVVLAAGTACVAAFKATNAATTQIYTVPLANASIASAMGFPAGGLVTRTSGGAWSAPVAATYPGLGLIIDQIDNGAAAVGGGFRRIDLCGGIGG